MLRRRGGRARVPTPRGSRELAGRAQGVSRQSGRRASEAAHAGPAPEAMSWLLDTDVICQPAKRHGDAKVIAWLDEEQDRCYTSAVVIAQLAYWVRTKDGRQRQTLQSWLTRLVDALHGRIHGFNVSVAHVWADQERILDKAGQPMPVEDSYIAATARRHGLTIATGNDRDFRRPGLKVFNPFKELS